MLVDAKWLEDHVSVISPYTLTCWRFLLRIVNLRLHCMGPLGKSIGPLVGKGGESDVECMHLQCCSPVSVS
jgi:hypothetical protein